MAEVETTRDGAVLTITLNRPDVLNAFTADMHRELVGAFKEARDPGVRAVVVTGAGRGAGGRAGGAAHSRDRALQAPVRQRRAHDARRAARARGPAPGRGHPDERLPRGRERVPREARTAFRGLLTRPLELS